MAKVHPFSVFLLKNGFTHQNSLVEDNKLLPEAPAKNLPEGSFLYILDNTPKTPWWVSFFGIDAKLSQVSKGALIFIPSGDRYFALSFGHVYHNLTPESYEYDFGLRVTLNSVDPQKLKSTDTLEPSAARRQRTQLPTDSNLTLFDFDQDSSILKSLTGKVKSELSELFKNSTGSSNLRISSNVASKDLASLCEKLLDLYLSDAYKDAFPNIQNIAPVRDPDVISLLDAIMLEKVKTPNDAADEQELFLAIPEIIDYSQGNFYMFTGEGAGLIYDDVYLERYYEYLKSRKLDLDHITIDHLKKHKLSITDEDGLRKSSFSIFRCLVGEVLIPNDLAVYHLTDGTWYKCQPEYISDLSNFLDPYFVKNKLPDFNHPSEGHYNDAVPSLIAGMISLDRTNFSIPKQTPIEPCDLIHEDKQKAIFTHIKISTLSSQLSHLFNQGVNSLELLRSDDQASDRLIALVDERCNDANLRASVRTAIDTKNIEVAYGIVTHKDATKNSQNLPLFSRISLRRALQDLKKMSAECVVFFIPDLSPKKVGKKRPRKKPDDNDDVVE